MPNASSFPDGRRGRVQPTDVGRVAEYAARTLPVGGPGMLRRTFPGGTTCFPLPSRRVTAGAAKPLHPWQPIPSPWTGTDQAPDDQKLKIRIRPGVVNDVYGSVLPARRNIEILVPPTCTDGYFGWLVAHLDGDGGITSLDYDHGTAPPARAGSIPADKTLPSVVRRLLFYVTSDAHAVNDFSNVFEDTSLNLFPVSIDYNVNNQVVTRSMKWTAGAEEH